MSYTTDPNDPRLGKGVDTGPVPQNEVYLVSNEGEFVRPVRTKYIHVGPGGYEIDPNDPRKHGRTGNGCGVLTVMGRAIAETYARDPKFYGATYCVGCGMHLPVDEFVWADTNERVGS